MSIDLDRWAEAFSAALVPQLRAALSRLVADVAPESVLGLGVYTDEDATSVVAAANTEPNWRAHLGDHPEYRNFYLWSTGEWDRTTVGIVAAGGPDDLADAVAEATRAADEVSSGGAGRDDYGVFRYVVWEAIVAALAQLFAEGFFDPYPRAVQVFEPIDAEVDDDTRRNWIEMINTRAAADDFAAWLANPSS